MSNTKIQFPFNSNYSVSTVPHHSVFLREVTHSSSTIRNWKHTSASRLQSDWWSRMIHGELTQKICLMSAMTSLISQLHLVCLLTETSTKSSDKGPGKVIMFSDNFKWQWWWAWSTGAWIQWGDAWPVLHAEWWPRSPRPLSGKRDGGWTWRWGLHWFHIHYSPVLCQSAPWVSFSGKPILTACLLQPRSSSKCYWSHCWAWEKLPQM